MKYLTRTAEYFFSMTDFKRKLDITFYENSTAK